LSLVPPELPYKKCYIFAEYTLVVSTYFFHYTFKLSTNWPVAVTFTSARQSVSVWGLILNSHIKRKTGLCRAKPRCALPNYYDCSLKRKHSVSSIYSLFIDLAKIPNDIKQNDDANFKLMLIDHIGIKEHKKFDHGQ
jgi:hypothetical protein